MMITRERVGGGAGRVLQRLSELIQSPILRLIDRLSVSSWAMIIQIASIVLVNILLTYFIISRQDNLAIAFTVIVIFSSVIIKIPEVSIVLFIVIGSGLFVNSLYYAFPGVGTGQNTIAILLLLAVSWHAIGEYLRLPKEERPRLFSLVTLGIVLYWTYYLAHVIHIYLFRYHETHPEDYLSLLGYSRVGLIRYFDPQLLWIGILPMIILLRDWNRAKRVLAILSILMLISLSSIVWEYFSPLPEFFRILFQLKASGETMEGYRVRDPSPLYLSLIGTFAAIYSLGYLRGWKLAGAVILILLGMFALLITKNRVVWAATLLVLPLLLVLKHPSALLRQLKVLAIVSLILSALLLHEGFYENTQRIMNETVERWNRNTAFGGDPRNDPSYQGRLREYEAWERNYARKSNTELLLGAGIDRPYGHYISLRSLLSEKMRLPFFSAYVERTGMHFAWYRRIHQIGWLGATLAALVFLSFFVRCVYIFFTTSDYRMRALAAGIAASTLCALAFDALHIGLFHRYEMLPLILMWSCVELIPRWRTQTELNREVT